MKEESKEYYALQSMGEAAFALMTGAESLLWIPGFCRCPQKLRDGRIVLVTTSEGKDVFGIIGKEEIATYRPDFIAIMHREDLKKFVFVGLMDPATGERVEDPFVNQLLENHRRTQ